MTAVRRTSIKKPRPHLVTVDVRAGDQKGRVFRFWCHELTINEKPNIENITFGFGEVYPTHLFVNSFAADIICSRVVKKTVSLARKRK
jgi:hypothetical protein